MAPKSSDERPPKVNKFRQLETEGCDEWRPKVQMNGGRKFRQMAAESFDERRPKVPSDGDRKFQFLIVGLQALARFLSDDSSVAVSFFSKSPENW